MVIEDIAKMENIAHGSLRNMLMEQGHSVSSAVKLCKGRGLTYKTRARKPIRSGYDHNLSDEVFA